MEDKKHDKQDLLQACGILIRKQIHIHSTHRNCRKIDTKLMT